jgi:hypothetical protein
MRNSLVDKRRHVCNAVGLHVVPVFEIEEQKAPASGAS